MHTYSERYVLPFPHDSTDRAGLPLGERFKFLLNKGQHIMAKMPGVDCASACPAIVAKSSAKLINDLRIIVTS